MLFLHIHAMRKIILFCLLIYSFNGFSNIILMQNNLPVRASELNSNFEHIQQELALRHIVVEFHNYQSGNIISKTVIEQDLDQIRNLGIQVAPLNEGKIKSAEINLAFSQMLQGITGYNSAPELTAMSIQPVINEPYTAQLSIFNYENDSLSFQVTQGSKGLASVSAAGLLEYIPNLNQYGSDSFTVTATDGSKVSDPVVISVNILGKGIITNDNGVKSYFDGTFATSCSSYYNQVNNNYLYYGSTGNGKYKIDTTGNFLTCDMTTPGGPWTERTTWNSSTYPSLMLAGNIFVSGNQSSTVLPSVGAGIRVVGIFKNTAPQVNYMLNKSAYTRTASAPGGVPGRYNYYGPTAGTNSNLLWSNLGVSFESNIVVFANGVVGKINTIANGCCGAGGESAYIYIYSMTSGAKFWVKEN